MYYQILTEETPEFEILSLSDAKAQLMITHDESDSKVQSCIDTAVEMAQDFTGRRFYPAIMMANFHYWHRIFTIVRGPGITISSVKYIKDNETKLTELDSSLYQVIDAGLETYIVIDDNNFNFDTLEDRPDAVQIEFSSAGYGSLDNVPKRIIQAVILYVRDLFTTGNRVDERISAADNLLLPYRCQR